MTSSSDSDLEVPSKNRLRNAQAINLRDSMCKMGSLRNLAQLLESP